jgi:hypothetical protein
MSEFYNIQSASPQYVPYGSTNKAMPTTKAMPMTPGPKMPAQNSSGTEQMIRGPMPSRKMSTDPMPNGHHRQNEPMTKEGFVIGDLSTSYTSLTGDPRYDMSDKILNYPQGHPLYAPQTLAEVRRTDSDAMLRSENTIFGIALASGISIIVLGFLMSSGKLSAPDMPTQM